MATLHHGDCLEVLRAEPESSVDSVITDPPYGLSFMGKKWDYDVPSVEIWREVLRVLKPGGHLLSFGGTRTYHRMVVNIEDAGFEIRDQIQWLYGSGFPKSHNISKAIDKEAGADREVVGQLRCKNIKGGNFVSMKEQIQHDITAPATDAAKLWDGWGTALKPANEPIVLARKPLSEKTVAANVLKWGTGGINVDGSRIEGAPRDPGYVSPPEELAHKGNGIRMGRMKAIWASAIPTGRFPANLILDEAAAEMLDMQSGTECGALAPVRQKRTPDSTNVENYKPHESVGDDGKSFRNDRGGASRFFYVAKASKRERGEGNAHPTVKPVKLMQYLCTLVTPPNGTVLDPFMGSGSTAIAALALGFQFIGIEREHEYVEIAKRRTETTYRSEMQR